MHREDRDGTYIQYEDICQRPNKWVLFLISFAQPFAKLGMALQNTTLDYFQTYTQVFWEKVGRYGAL